MANAETIYLAKNAAPLVNPTAATVFTVSDPVAKPTLAAAIYLPEYEGYPGSQQTGFPTNTINAPVGSSYYSVVIQGRVVPGTSGTFQVGLQIGNNAVAANNVNFVLPTAATYATAGDFFVRVNLIYSPTTGRLDATYSAGSGSTFAAVVPTAVTGQTINLIGQKVGLVVTGIFGTSNTNNIAYLDNFALQQE